MISLKGAVLSFLLPLVAAHGHHRHLGVNFPDATNLNGVPITNKANPVSAVNEAKTAPVANGAKKQIAQSVSAPIDTKTFSCGSRKITVEKEMDFEEKKVELRNGEIPIIGSRRRLQSSVVTIPVTHFVYSDDGTDKVTEAQIGNQMDWLNQAFAGTGFVFELEGITRIVDPIFSAYDGNRDFLDAEVGRIRNGCMETLNVFWVDLFSGNGDLGYATPPGFDENINVDGVVMDFRASTGGMASGFDEGDILVHEVSVPFDHLL